ncbi:MAG TPA: ATP-binding protein [Candidatus Hydrogenedentes bacterium]|nr:ATP-binding protein [Candidatus Hydrogenedentota bacterium]
MQDGKQNALTDSASMLQQVDRLQATLTRLETTSGMLPPTAAADLLRSALDVCRQLEKAIRDSAAELDAQQSRLQEAEMRIRQADERFLLAYENCPFSMAIANLSEGRFRDVNPMFLSRLGYAREEVIGKTSDELQLFPESQGRRWLLEALHKDGRAEGIELMARGKDGVFRWGRIYARIVSYNGEKCILSLTQSIEEIRAAEQEALRLRQFYEQLLEDLPAQIAVFDTQGRYLYVSPSSVMDAELRAWLINRTDFDYCERKERDRGMAERRAEWIASAVATREIVSQEERFETQNGIRHFIRTYKPVQDRSGTVTHVISYGHDITDYKLLEDQLRHAQKMEAVGRLAGGVAHDFNNLLTAMMGIADFILPQVEGNPTLEAGIAEIQHAAERAASLTRQLLAFSRRAPVRNVPVDPNGVIDALANMLRRIIGETVSLTLSLDRSVPCIMGDPGRLEQIIMNLVVNARDAMPSGGALTIETSRVRTVESDDISHTQPMTGDFARITVRDTGIGMDLNIKQHIFEPFFTTKSEDKGTGLGLSTVYAIVERWDGLVRVESEPNSGTAFHVFIPCAEQSVTCATAAPRPSSGTSGSETVLVVEDEDAVRDVVCRILGRCGYTVLEAANGEEALTMAEHYTGPIDMLVSDMVMPGMSGRQLAEKLVLHRAKIRMLFMSGHCEDMDAEFVSHLQPPTFIQKPFTSVELATKVRELLDANVNESH